MNVFCLLEQTSRRFADRDAVYVGTTRVQTYAELRLRALRLAAGLRDRAPRGSRIAIASENRPEYLEIMFGVWAAECVIVPLNYKLHPKEMGQIIEDENAAIVFASPGLAAGFAAALCSAPVENRAVAIIGSGGDGKKFWGE